MGAAHGSDQVDVDRVMDMPAHRAMFSGFLKATEWGVVLLAMLLALLVCAFAIGLGWWAGLAAWIVIGLGAGLLMGMGGAWWATLVVSSLLLGVGGAAVMGLQGLI